MKQLMEILCCDTCKKPIETFDENGKRKWIEGAFQMGMNSKGEVGTWCGESCYELNNKIQSQ